jgi:hypothetical protein
VGQVLATDGSGSTKWVAGSGLAMYGNGLWGDFTMDGSTDAPNPSGTPALSSPTTGAEQGSTTAYYSTNGDTYWHNLIVDSGIALFTEGDRLFVAGTLTLNGLVDFGPASTHNASGATGGGASGSGADPVGQETAGPNGGTGAGTGGNSPAAGSGAPGGSSKLGGASGAGGSANGGGTAGGAGRTIPILGEAIGAPFGLLGAHGFNLTPNGLVQYVGAPSGGAGAGDGTFAGGGGGAGAGLLVVFARFITGTGTIWCSGGNGGAAAGGNAGGGGGGGGGGLIIVTESAVWNGSAYTIPGITVASVPGSGGAGSGTGAAGSAGSAGRVIIMPG